MEFCVKLLSLPLWERGLKYKADNPGDVPVQSLPLWERGLKYERTSEPIPIIDVAPLVGAWIEMTDWLLFAMPEKSLPLWERGLKYDLLDLFRGITRRSPCGSVD